MDCRPTRTENWGSWSVFPPSRLREMHNVDLTGAQSRTTELANGDKLRILVIRPTLENSVILTDTCFARDNLSTARTAAHGYIGQHG